MIPHKIVWYDKHSETVKEAIFKSKASAKRVAKAMQLSQKKYKIVPNDH